MKLKTTFLKDSSHSVIVTGLSWFNTDEVYSCGDDHAIIKWNFSDKEVTKVCVLPEDLFPTGIHWFPRNGKKSSDLMLITATDGKFYFITKSGRIERSFDAHQGAILTGLWSYDGAGLLTAGEDGQVKIWSKGGMLRSTLITGDVPIYAAAWSPDSNSILVAQGRSLLIKPLAPNLKFIKWRAHDGLILAVSWSQTNNKVISGGEDCKYKVWDNSGHCLYSSSAFEHPVATVAWSPLSDLFVAGSFNTLQLCDQIGWAYSMEKLQTGSIYGLSWSSDGTQLAAACGNGSVFFGHIVERKIDWKNFMATQISRRKVIVKDILNEVEETLDFAERIVRMSFEFGYFIATTPSQCYIFSVKNWNTPCIVDLKEGPGSFIVMARKHFLIVGSGLLNLYNYDGKLHEAAKVVKFNTKHWDEKLVSLSSDTLAFVDQTDEKQIQLFDLTGRQTTSLPSINHSLGITKIALSKTENDRQLAFIDKNQDLYVGKVKNTTREASRFGKLSPMIEMIVWCSDAEILAGLKDSILNVWLYPQVVQVDKFLTKKTSLVRDLSDVGKNLSITSYEGNIIKIRRMDGAVNNQLIPANFVNLQNILYKGNWEAAMRLCCSANEELLWACLACMACAANQLNIAEEAYGALGETDKVAYIQRAKRLSNKPVQMAYMALLSGNTYSAEMTLTQSGFIYFAILLNMQIYNWERALDLAVKHRTHIDTVLYKRKCYLEALDKSETNKKFLKYQKEVELDVDKIQEKIRRDAVPDLLF